MDTLKKKIVALRYKLGAKYRQSYSQCGEDIIINRVLRDMGVHKPFYIDLGANDPIIFSNTYLFYRGGSRGICVEPNPKLSRRIARTRPRDTVLSIGVGIKKGAQEFHIMDNDSLSTFSSTESALEVAKGHTLIEKVMIPIQTINDILSSADRDIDLISLDIEGLDKIVLETLDFEKFRPKVICVETRSFGSTNEDAQSNLVQLMKKHGYNNVGYTPVNSIFADSGLSRTK